MQALPFIMMAGTAVSAYGEYQAAKYQSAIVEHNANLMQENMERENFAASQDMMDRDLAARAEMAEVIANMGASGLSADSGSMLLRRRSLSELADRDRQRLGEKKDTQNQNYRDQIGSARVEAKQMRSAAKTNLLMTPIKMATSYLSGASMVNQYNTSAAGLSAPSYNRR